MAYSRQAITEAWVLITSAATFTVQNLSNRTMEFRFDSGLPDPDDTGLSIAPKHAVDSSMGSGNLYGRCLSWNTSSAAIFAGIST